ncbi:phage tail tape measure protein [Phocaeicola sp.]|uniref:phage tail tape measure protein n=1 Tax=Phocaeicola sp. TaxID=2773926 RepID=UPI003AB40124
MADLFTRLLLDTKGFDRNITKAQKEVGAFASVSKGVFGGLAKFGGYVAAFAGISTSIHAAVTANMEFEKSLSTLRAITGVTAEELNYFRAEAIRMGMDSTQSATQMVEAFKLIGGQMPELLKNKTALTQTAEAAVTLAEAAELDVPTAAKALTGALNQMGQSSNHAREYINILAAASQEGAAEIPYLNAAIEKAGGTATVVGVKFSDLVASIEAIAPRVTEASTAGISLRNVFLTLESQADARLRPSVVGLSKALENLAAMNLDATQMTKMFGRETVTAAIALLQERDNFEELRKKIVDTNAAYDMARTNNDNLAGSVSKLENAWASLVNSFSKSNGFLQWVIDDITYLVNKVTELTMSADELAERKYAGEKQTEVDESNKRIRAYMDSGMTKEQALNKEILTANTMYPEAAALEVRKRQLEKLTKQATQERLVSFNDVSSPETAKAMLEMKKLVELSQREYLMRQAIYDNVEAQRKEMEAAAKAQEDINKETANAANPDIPRIGSAAYLDKEITAKRKEVSLAISDKDRLRLSQELDELVKQRRYMDLEIKYKTDFISDTRQRKDMAKAMKEFRDMAQLPDFSNEKIKWENPLGKEQTDSVNEYANALQSVSSIMGSLGGLIKGNSDNMAEWALSSAANIAQMIVQLQALATANGVASAFSAPWPANLAAVATVMSTVASIFSSLPQFAEGGIVGGSSFFGDKLLARVNSGEMILNRDQQRTLYSLTETDRAASVNIGFDKVRGSDIYLSLSNYMKKTGKKL